MQFMRWGLCAALVLLVPMMATASDERRVNIMAVEAVAVSTAAPIVVEMSTTFQIGRGPMATGDTKTINYWIAVTDRNKGILAKQPFSFVAKFPRGADRVLEFQHTDQITIPRAAATVSGENFEVLVGFEVTPEQAAFNRDGTRFPIDATGRSAQAAGAPAAR